MVPGGSGGSLSPTDRQCQREMLRRMLARIERDAILVPWGDRNRMRRLAPLYGPNSSTFGVKLTSGSSGNMGRRQCR